MLVQRWSFDGRGAVGSGIVALIGGLHDSNNLGMWDVMTMCIKIKVSWKIIVFHI